MMEAMKTNADTNHPATENTPVVPTSGTADKPKKSAGMTRKRFAELLKRAIAPAAPKPTPKSF